MKLMELLSMEICEINHVTRGGTNFTVDISIINNQWQIGILKYISKN